MSQPDDFQDTAAERHTKSEGVELFQRAADLGIQNQRLLSIAAILNSALVLTAIFVAGLHLGNALAWKLAVCTMALAYIGPMVQLQFPTQRLLAAVLTGGSIIFGGIALISLTGWTP